MSCGGRCRPPTCWAGSAISSKTASRFAVTQTYVGPDRRSKERSDPKRDKLVEVPNVIGAKAKNDAEALSLVAHKTKVAMTAIKTLKVERYGVTILMKIYDLLSRIDAGQNDEARQLADEIVVLLAEISSRLSTTKFKDIVPVFKGLSTALKELKAKADLTKQDAKRLEPLSRKVAEVFGGTFLSVSPVGRCRARRPCLMGRDCVHLNALSAVDGDRNGEGSVGENCNQMTIKKRKMSVDWTEEQIKELIALWNQGLPTSEIGRKIGATKNAVVGKAHRLGLTKRQSPIRRKPQEVRIVKLDGLRAGMCSWPIGRAGDGRFSFLRQAGGTG